MSIRVGLAVATMLAGCSFSGKIGSSSFGAPSTAPTSATAAPQTAGGALRGIPDLTGKTIEEADAALRAAGFEFDRVERSDFVCEYRDDRAMVRQGTVCGQEPRAGAERLPKLIAVRVTIERDTYAHGAVGDHNEWRRMPDVAGQPIDVARSALGRAHLPIGEHFEVVEMDVDGCAAGDVCATEPPADGRKVIARKGRIYVGKTRPAEVTTTPSPASGDSFF